MSETPEEKKEVKETPETPAGENKDLNENIDYKAELEAEQTKFKEKETQLGKAEHKIEELKKKEPQIDMEQLKETIVDAVKSEVGALSQQLDADKVTNTIKGVSSDEDEANLIAFHLKNSIKSSGNITDDIAKAKALANQKKVTTQIEEVKRTLEAKDNAENKVIDGQKKSQSKKGPEATYGKEAIEYARKQGLIWSEDKQKFIGQREFKQSQAK